MNTLLKLVNYAVISEPLTGEHVCGDQYYIKECDDSTLFAVIDGLGHGEDAAVASNKAREIIDAHANESLENIFTHCNKALLATRGAAMTIVRVTPDHTLTYMGIGNVYGLCWELTKFPIVTRQSIFLVGGIVGSRFPPLINAKTMPLSAGDVIILATDGINPDFENEPASFDSPQKIAKKIFTTYRNEKDDGLVLVIKLV